MSEPAAQSQLSLTERQQLERCEEVITRGLETFVEVGEALLTIRAGRLYRHKYDYDTFETYCRERWGWSKSRANQLVAASEAIGNLTTAVVKPTSEWQIRPLTKLPPEQQAAAWMEAVERAGEDPVTSRVVQEVVNERLKPSSLTRADYDDKEEEVEERDVEVMLSAEPTRMSYVGSQPGTTDRDGNDWHTPEVYLAAVRDALDGEIDLDPYNSDIANATVRAKVYFTANQPAPAGEDWPQCATCFMNPPYSGGVVRDAVEKFLAAYEGGRFEKGILLVNNATETRFAELLFHRADAVCFTNHRICFVSPDGKVVSNNTRGQMFFYFGPSPKMFGKVFGEFGVVLPCGPALLGKGN